MYRLSQCATENKVASLRRYWVVLDPCPSSQRVTLSLNAFPFSVSHYSSSSIFVHLLVLLSRFETALVDNIAVPKREVFAGAGAVIGMFLKHMEEVDKV